MDNFNDVAFAVFEGENGELIGKFKKTNREKALKLRAYLEEQVKILNRPTDKCHRLRTILEMKGVKSYGRRNLERH